MLAVLSLALSLLAAAPAAQPASGASAAAPTPAAKAATEAEKDPLICRYEAPIGTRLPKRVCANRSVREEAERLSRDAAEKVQRNSRGPYKTEP